MTKPDLDFIAAGAHRVAILPTRKTLFPRYEDDAPETFSRRWLAEPKRGKRA